MTGSGPIRATDRPAFPARPALSDPRRNIPPPAPRQRSVPRTDSPLLATLHAHPDAADRVWADVVAGGTPVVEGSGSTRTYTFLHRGEASRVALVANKMADDTSYHDVLLERVPGTDIWGLALSLGQAWRGSYRIAVLDGRPPGLTEPELALLDRRRARSRSVTPPERHAAIDAWFGLQRHVRRDPLAREQGARESIASGPQAPAPEPPPRPAGPGTIAPAGPRAWWHVPAAEVGPDGLDLLVLLDGDRWRAAGAAAIDALTGDDADHPRATLLIGHGGAAERTAELACNPALLARVQALIGNPPADIGPITEDPARTTIAGQSMGGLAALHAQCAAPDRYGSSVCQSGSFWWPNPASGEPAEWLTRAIAATGAHLDHVALQVGTGEWTLLAATRRLRELLQDRCRQLDYLEYDGGHDSACWDAYLPGALRAPGSAGGRLLR